MKRAWLVLLSGVAALSCSDTTVDPGIQLNLDRPVDISFVCYGPLRLNGATDKVTTAQPPAWCNTRSPQLTPNKREPMLAAAVAAPPSGQDIGTNPNLPEVPSWRGFILQSASGTVAVSQMPSQPDDQFASAFSTSVGASVIVLDADPRAPGKNAISVGEEPIALAGDLSACYEMTANAGSCDLTALDINSVLTNDSSVAVRVERRDVLNGNGEKLRAKPAAMVIQPNTNQPIGNACPKASEPVKPTGVAYVAYPGCSLVAAVDLESRKMVAGVRLIGGAATVLSATDVATMSCPNECAGAQPLADVRPSTLSLQVDDRAATTRLAIGAENSAIVTVIDLDSTTFLPRATAPVQVTLAPAPGKPLGVTTVSLSPQIAMGNGVQNPAYPRRNNNVGSTFLHWTGQLTAPTDGTAPVKILEEVTVPADPIGTSPGREGQYVYAVATDGTVRVADVLQLKRECDTNIDTRFVRALTAPADIPKLQCLPIGDPTLPRRSGAKGPGIEIPSDGPPTSVAIVKGLDRPATTQAAASAADGDPEPVAADRSPGMLIGYFAVITASSGQVYVANVDDDDGPDQFDPNNPIGTAPVLAMAHQLRDGFGARSATTADTITSCTAADPALPLTGGPRASAPVVPTVPANTYPTTPALNQADKSKLLPTLKQEQCKATTTDPPADPRVEKTFVVSQVQLGATQATRDVVFPDLRSVRSETWAMTWEGALSNDTLLRAVDGPVVRTGQLKVDSRGVHLLDLTQPFCEMGVEALDYVQLRGCNATNNNSSGANADCPSGYVCYVHKDNRVPNLGQCMLAAEAPRLADACHDFLTTARRYAVSRTASDELQLVPRKHVLSTTPVDGCTDDAQCQRLANYTAGLRLTSQPSVATTDTHTWACRADETRRPVTSGARCVEACKTTVDCDVGTICVGSDGATASGTCMESVAPPQACVNGPQHFEVHATDAFVVTGTQSGYIHPFIVKGGAGADAKSCVRDPAASSLQTGRIPLVAPACDMTANPITGKTMTGFEANPCSTTVPHAEAKPKSSATMCIQDPTMDPDIADRAAPAIKFRNPAFTITMVDPWSPGDQTCIGDREATNLGKVPLMLSPGFESPLVQGYQVSFVQRAGFLELTAGGASLVPAFPVKVVRGPSDSIWVMDDGDFQAVAIGQSSTRGQVYRVSITNLQTLNVLQ